MVKGAVTDDRPGIVIEIERLQKHILEGAVFEVRVLIAVRIARRSDGRGCGPGRGNPHGFKGDPAGVLALSARKIAMADQSAVGFPLHHACSVTSKSEMARADYDALGTVLMVNDQMFDAPVWSRVALLDR